LEGVPAHSPSIEIQRTCDVIPSGRMHGEIVLGKNAW
jgi:hypothetical protein